MGNTSTMIVLLAMVMALMASTSQAGPQTGDGHYARTFSRSFSTMDSMDGRPPVVRRFQTDMVAHSDGDPTNTKIIVKHRNFVDTPGGVVEVVTDADVAPRFVSSQLVPDVLDAPPSTVLKAHFGSGVAALGNTLDRHQLHDAPTVSWTADAGALYTLIMVGVEAVRKPGGSHEWLHWLVANIPGADVTKGEVVDVYAAPDGPPRCVLLAYRQPRHLSLTADKGDAVNGTNGGARGKFTLRGFVKQHGLGQPTAGNFIQVSPPGVKARTFSKMSAESAEAALQAQAQAEAAHVANQIAAMTRVADMNRAMAVEHAARMNEVQQSMAGLMNMAQMNMGQFMG